tara:strand:+ start:149 stop:877 length:729 start_codon:yes stop_codon:yes gene_type:complete
MNKNVVVITAMEGLVSIDCKPYCLNTWQYWCDKNNTDLIVLDEPLMDTSVLKPTWQRWYVWEVLENSGLEYDKVALVDVDTMVKWNSPNFFDLVDGFSACSDNDNVGWVKQSIDGYKKFFDIDLDWEDYFNCGFIVMTKNEKSLCKKIIDFESENREELIQMQETLRKGTDQTPINYLTRTYNSVKLLPKKYNLTHLNRKEILQDGMFIDLGYVWHFNGFDKQHRLPIMKDTWELIKSNYEK